jgi:hypothetical protein
MIKAPLRDEDGSVQPHDHDEILNNHEIIRRVSERQIVTDSSGKKINSSIIFKASEGKNSGMSVDLRQLIETAGINPKSYVTTPRWTGSLLFKVADLRGLGFKVGYDPIEKPEPNPYHGEVWGTFSKGESGTRKKLQNLAVWFVEIENVSIR